MANYSTLQEMMNSFQNGLFYNLSDRAFSLPNGIGHLLEADDTGCIWFLFHVHSEQAASYEEECAARIRLYDKEQDHYIDATGKAVLLRDPEDWTKCSKISYGMAKALRYHGLIVRFRINHATVVEKGRNARRNFFQRLMDDVNSWLSGRNIAETEYPAPILSH
ncbi:hypothetical protein [Flavihumibacter petaseus]|uniref:Uncharacterized protein n=1 Tax=Flavihumibacter petaseus NBRC 106054 TaxID=1220578 RepID=A0A0E9MYE5_9BACT|nr:hypothetical protein [Flavihumibacter petaseus]GAO42431.1 hypothetical protein FPE01S_01_14460 [Flavihumibacter petaseus NBRC 106054]